MGPTDQSLAEILSRCMTTGEPMPVAVALAIVRQICELLHAGHSFRDAMGNIAIHGDLAPQHISIGEGGIVSLAASTTPQGTVAYAAPEYVMTGALDLRADLFALGVIAHEMLANRPLFWGADPRQTLERVCTMPVPPPSTLNPRVPSDVDAIVLTALARDPAHRWQHTAVLRDTIDSTAQALGLQLGPAQIAAWLAPPAAPSGPATMLGLAAPLPPAAAPRIWQDEDNEATRMDAPPEPPPPEPEPPPAAPKLRLTSSFGADIGPEPTNIGAKPLIEFGNTGSLNALVGEGSRPSGSLSSKAAPLPPSEGTFVPAAKQRRPRRGLRLAIAGISLIVVAAVVVLVVLFAT